MLSPRVVCLIELFTSRVLTVAALIGGVGVSNVASGYAILEESFSVLFTSLTRRRVEADQIVVGALDLDVFHFVDCQTFDLLQR